MSVYGDVEREARQDHRAWLADEYEGPDYDPADDDEPTTAPETTLGWGALAATTVELADETMPF